ncbi:MAG TPA: nitroreductase family protein, partial [Bacteroidales bacterium]|nr:nitroreductase family protein [Bacteroidales bacterium]
MAKAKDIQMNRSMHPLIAKRWSPRSFTDENINEKDLESIFLAASWAPSSMNEQPWRYLYALHRDKEFSKFVDCLNPTNQEWAKNAAV